MAVGHNGVVLAVYAVQLLGILDDDVHLAAVSGDVGNGLFNDGQLAQRGELIQHQQTAMLVGGHACAVLELHRGADAPDDEIDDQTHERPYPVNGRRTDHKEQVDRFVAVHEVMDTEVG